MADTINTPQLPPEILVQIFDELVADDEVSFDTKAATLKRCRLVSQDFNDLVLPFLYRKVSFGGPHAFFLFLEELKAYPERGKFVRTLDFSSFTSIGLGRSKDTNRNIHMLTSQTLAECLTLTKNVEEVFVSEALESDIDAKVLTLLFGGYLPKLRSVDFCAADSGEFLQAWAEFSEEHLAPREGPRLWIPSVRNLSFHNCSTLPSEFFELLLSQLPNLEVLDLYNTKVNGPALQSIPHSCRIRELCLSQCGRLTSGDLMRFMLYHPASAHLESLQVYFSWTKTHPLQSHHLDYLIPHLPKTLTNLDLSGVDLTPIQVKGLPHDLRELGVHSIDLSAVENVDDLGSLLPRVDYLHLSTNVLGSEAKQAAILLRLFPSLLTLECPAISRLHQTNSRTWKLCQGKGRRNWFTLAVDGKVEQRHPRKLNLNLQQGRKQRGLYEYYAFRV